MVSPVARLSRGKSRGTFFYKVLSNFQIHSLSLFFWTTFWRCFLQQFNKYEMLAFYLRCGLNLLQTKFFLHSASSPHRFFSDHDHLKALVYMVRSIHLGEFKNKTWFLTCRLLVSSNLFPTRTISGFFNLPCLSCCPNSIQSGTLSKEQQFVRSKQTKITWQSRRYDGMRQRKRSWPAVSHIWRRTAIPSVAKGTN